MLIYDPALNAMREKTPTDIYIYDIDNDRMKVIEQREVDEMLKQIAGLAKLRRIVHDLTKIHPSDVVQHVQIAINAEARRNV